MILADTDVLIDFLAGIEPVCGQIAAYLATERLKTTAITSFELLSGAREGRRGEVVRKLIQELDVVPLDRHAATRAADVRQRLERNGETIGMADSLIAGIAISSGLPLFTRNRRHFEKVAGLTLIDLAGSSCRADRDSIR